MAEEVNPRRRQLNRRRGVNRSKNWQNPQIRFVKSGALKNTIIYIDSASIESTTEDADKEKRPVGRLSAWIERLNDNGEIQCK